METRSEMWPGLTPEEREEYGRLVDEGVRLHEERRKVRQDAHTEAEIVKFGKKAEWRKEWKRKLKKDDASRIDDAPDPLAVRWLLARRAGLSPQKAALASGCEWRRVVDTRFASYSFRRAWLAVYDERMELMREMACGTVEDCLSGEREVSAVAARTAQWGLERLDPDRFGDPRLKADPAVSAAKAVGGIVINLVDVSKPYVPPAIAAKGDPEEGVEV